MRTKVTLWLPLLMLLGCCSATLAQGAAQSQDVNEHSAAAAGTETEQKNIQEYINLLRTNVRQQKSEIMGAMMGLDPDDASKFWPIYSAYDNELRKLNDLRLANLQDYARHYADMTDAKTDELMQRALGYRRQRTELLSKYYDRVKTSLGATQAARFLQVENQLLEIIDLQIESSLPIAAEGKSTKEK